MSWPASDLWRTPVGDWPPPWASSWGSDRYGLWADLVVGGVTQRLRWIEPSGPEGFRIGDPGEQLHKVVDAGFWLADTPCTQAFWVQIAEAQTNPSQFQQGEEAGQRPVERVSWDDVQQWLGRLAQRCPATAGLAALPTEVQWEYACRAGTTTAYWWGDRPDPNRANTDVRGDRDLKGSKGVTTLVKHHAPNPWGLYDMHGNVWEWCEHVSQERLDGAVGVEEIAMNMIRPVRGGSWFYPPYSARSASHSVWPRYQPSRDQGFRIYLRYPSSVPWPESRTPRRGRMP